MLSRIGSGPVIGQGTFMHRILLIFGLCVAMLWILQGCSRPTYSGRELYGANCASCHGRYADGQGPAAADAPGPVPDLRYLAARNGGTFPREWVVDVIDGRKMTPPHHGERQMPVWGDVFAQRDGPNGSAKAQAAAKIQALVDYLMDIQQRE